MREGMVLTSLPVARVNEVEERLMKKRHLNQNKRNESRSRALIILI